MALHDFFAAQTQFSGSCLRYRWLCIVQKLRVVAPDRASHSTESDGIDPESLLGRVYDSERVNLHRHCSPSPARFEQKILRVAWC